jgi:hypothetical protein
MDEENTASDTMPQPHTGVCPNGHDVPTSRATCGVCDLEPIPSKGPAATERPDPSNEPRSVSKVAWGALIVLAAAAIVVPLLGDDVLLAEDFTTPEVLRTWPDDGATLTYTGDTYHVMVVADDSVSSAFQELPRTVGGLTMQVNAVAAQGNPAVILECVSEVQEVPAPNDPSVTNIEVVAGYTFVLLPNDSYAILLRDEVLSSGRIPSDGSSRVTVGCVNEGSGGTTLTMQVGDAEPVEVTDPDGLDSFTGVGLGAYGETSGSAVSYDDLEVVESS